MYYIKLRNNVLSDIRNQRPYIEGNNTMTKGQEQKDKHDLHYSKSKIGHCKSR